MLKKTLLSFAMVAFSGSVLAAPTANIYVKGKIGAPTCTVNGQDTADIIYNYDVELGAHNYHEFPNIHILETQDQLIDIQCDTATALTFNVIDARDGSALDEENFGLGMHEQTKIGFFAIKFTQPKIKETPESSEQAAYTTFNDDISQPLAGFSSDRYLEKNQNFGWGINGGLAVASNFSAILRVTPSINPELKEVASEVELDGLAILSFSFGI